MWIQLDQQLIPLRILLARDVHNSILRGRRPSMSEANEKQFNSDMQAEEPRSERDGAPRWVWLAVVVLATVSVLGLAVGWNATTQAKRAEQALATQTGQNKLVGQDLQALNQRLTQAEEINTQLQNQLVTVTDK